MLHKQAMSEQRKRCPDQAKAYEQDQAGKTMSQAKEMAKAFAQKPVRKSVADKHPAYPSPTKEDLDDPQFRAVWEAIKSWDVNVPEWYDGYTGAMGNHAMAIVHKLRALDARKK